MKKRTTKDISGRSAKIIYLPLLCLLSNGCSYYGGHFSYFDFTDKNKETIERRKDTEKFWTSVRMKSNLSDAHYRLGLHYQQMGEHEKALSEFNKALRNDHSYCKAFNGLAMTYDLQKRCEPARVAYEQAVTCAPGEAYVYNNYACSSLLCGNYDKGMELLLKADSIAAKDIRIKNNLRIAQSIAMREDLSEYLKSGNMPQPAITGQPPAPMIDNKMPLHPVQAVPMGVPTVVLSQKETSDMSADDSGQPVKGIATAAQGKTPDLLQVAAEADNPVVEGSKEIETSTAFSLPMSMKVAVEVSNGNGTTGMAKRSAAFLRNQGFTVRSITNAQHFSFEESTIYYKEEYLQTAKNLAAVIPGAQNLEQVETLTKASIGIKVVLGRDLAQTGFPGDLAGIANYRQANKLQPAILTASNNQVHF